MDYKKALIEEIERIERPSMIEYIYFFVVSIIEKYI